MPPLVQIRMQLKNDGINRALMRLQENSSRLPDYLANKACNSISYKAWQNMPKVTPWEIDQELEVSSHGITKKGRLSKAKKPRNVSVASHSSSLAQRIVLASFYPKSPFNVRTGGVFRRSKPGTHGKDEFWAWVEAKAAQMTKARHSAAGFFANCANAVNKGFGIVLGKVSSAKWMPDPTTGQISSNVDVNKVTKLLNKGLAQVTPAQNGSGRAAFSVAATEPDTKGKQEALYKIAQPVWQAAVDEEAKETFAYAQRLYKAAAEDAGIPVR